MQLPGSSSPDMPDRIWPVSWMVKPPGGAQENAGPQLTLGLPPHHSEGSSACDAAVFLLQPLLYHGPAAKLGGMAAAVPKATAPRGVPGFG